jgi:DNA replication protein DnaC
MYNRENFEKAKNELTRRRTFARAEADRRNEEVRDASPEIDEIDRELSKTAMLIFGTAVRGGDIEAVKNRNQELMAKRRAAIVALGYPEDYTEVHYHCAECSDTGYVNDGMKMCKCMREVLVRETVLSSGMGNLIDRQSFENFSLDRFKGDPETLANMERAVKTAKKYATAFTPSKGNLLFVGTTGTGKTHLSTAIAKEVINQGFDVVYDTMQNIANDFEDDKFRSGYGYAEKKSEKYLECDLLIIDDLGAEFVTQFTLATLYNLLNTRQNKKLATLISTNLDPNGLSATYEGRICSRLLGKDTTLVMFSGEDARIFN